MTPKGSVDTMGIERDDRGIVVHGGPGCTCTASGEDPRCPHHGYEAVIQRLEAQLAGAVEALRELDGMALAARNAGQTLDPETVAAMCDAALAPIVGGQ